MAWHGHPPIHADRRVPRLARRYKGLAAASFRLEAAAFKRHTAGARDLEEIRRGVEAAQRASRPAWLAYYRRCIVDVGAQFARQGIPPQQVRRAAGDEETEWGPRQDPWWVDVYRQRLGDEAWWDPWLVGMLRYADTTAAARVQHITEATRAQVASIIRDGVSNGDGVAAVRDAIDGLYLEDFTKVRAERIARTEVLNSARAGSYEAVLSIGLGDEATKSWQDSGDALVRDTHSAATADNQDIPYTEPFQVASARTGEVQLLNFPGDSSLGADASNVVNCRCDLLADSQRHSPT